LLSFSRKTHRVLAGYGARRGGIAPSGMAFQVEVVGSSHNAAGRYQQLFRLAFLSRLECELEES